MNTRIPLPRHLTAEEVRDTLAWRNVRLAEVLIEVMTAVTSPDHRRRNDCLSWARQQLELIGDPGPITMWRSVTDLSQSFDPIQQQRQLEDLLRRVTQLSDGWRGEE